MLTRDRNFTSVFLNRSEISVQFTVMKFEICTYNRNSAFTLFLLIKWDGIFIKGLKGKRNFTNSHVHNISENFHSFRFLITETWYTSFRTSGPTTQEWRFQEIMKFKEKFEITENTNLWATSTLNIILFFHY